MFPHELIKIAFRKLKASVYFDKTALALRDKVVDFEASADFETKLFELAEAYNNAVLDENSKIITKIIESINTLPFPKKTEELTKSTHESGCVISVGNPKESAVVSNLQYFIDMDVRGHILGILWIMRFGKRLDDICYKNSFGNRLRKSLIWDEESDEPINDPRKTPALFAPYFGQYSLWRDGALSCAEDILKKGQDALILTLDLKRFYYNTGITKESFDDLICEKDIVADKKLHSTVFRIIERYTQVLKDHSVECSGNVLPIGFLPSAVLSNWCLLKFDNGMLDYWNPIYYGRYVDDIIIVEKIEKDSEIYKKAHNNKPLSNEDVIKYFLGGERNKNANLFVKSSAKVKSELFEEDKIITYRVNPEYCLSEKSKFEFQADKTRVFALFADNNSSALLSKFKRQIFENVSEFKLMPELGDAFSQDDFSQFYNLENDATINKLRGIRNISMDKYELSKFLGKYRVISTLIDDGPTKKFTGIIGKMFNERELIDNYILWERALEIFVTDKDYSGFTKFVKKISDAIADLDFKPDDKATIKKYDIQISLQSHLNSSVSRVISLLWGEDVRHKILNKLPIELDFYAKNLHQSYLLTRMINKYVMAIPVEVITCPPDNESVNFTDFNSALKYLQNKRIEVASEYEFLPYFLQAQDIAITMFLQKLLNSQIENNKVDEYSEINYLNKIQNVDPEKMVETFSIKKDDDRGISIGKQKSAKLKIAVANVNVSKVYKFDEILKGKKTNRKYSRYKDLADIVNAAIKENADMLIFPENYIPFEWLSPLSAKAAREGLAIVSGIEHIILNNKIYNETVVILPFKYFNSIPTSAVFFQLKKHYSPDETQLIEGYGYKVQNGNKKRKIYKWKDCYFPVYCCYELTAIKDRSEFISWADMIIAVEFNKDTNYFSSIVESLSRDLHCYCVQVNTSEYGDSRIVQPTRSEEKNILSVKGGLNQTLLVGEINISELREFQLKTYALQKDGKFKPTPPEINVEIVKNKIGRHIVSKDTDEKEII